MHVLKEPRRVMNDVLMPQLAKGEERRRLVQRPTSDEGCDLAVRDWLEEQRPEDGRLPVNEAAGLGRRMHAWSMPWQQRKPYYTNEQPRGLLARRSASSFYSQERR